MPFTFCLCVRPAVRPGLVSPEARDRGHPVGGHVGDGLSHSETLEGKHARSVTQSLIQRKSHTCGNQM